MNTDSITEQLYQCKACNKIFTETSLPTIRLEREYIIYCDQCNSRNIRLLVED